ncbi:MAG: nitrophenyl compound nitroreductase subunit ArsF family protein [Candidatus Auribacterota bacterium]|jgi:hypothetical protein|nr:nitrophenyl compound nitroreductase subunit ArsF family protein [Candidatus Auribacterota bacterium]
MIRKIIVLSYVFLFFTAFKLYADQNDYVTAYYFYTTIRCRSCHNIENYTGETINKNFADQLESGSLKYTAINIEEKGNEHFVKDYNLYTKSVVLSLVKDGKEIKSKNLDKVWQYLGNKNKFTEYVKTETESFLNELK